MRGGSGEEAHKTQKSGEEHHHQAQWDEAQTAASHQNGIGTPQPGPHSTGPAESAPPPPSLPALPARSMRMLMLKI